MVSPSRSYAFWKHFREFGLAFFFTLLLAIPPFLEGDWRAGGIIVVGGLIVTYGLYMRLRNKLR